MTAHFTCHPDDVEALTSACLSVATLTWEPEACPLHGYVARRDLRTYRGSDDKKRPTVYARRAHLPDRGNEGRKLDETDIESLLHAANARVLVELDLQASPQLGAALRERFALAAYDGFEGFLIPFNEDQETPEPDWRAIERVKDVIKLRLEVLRTFPAVL